MVTVEYTKLSRNVYGESEGTERLIRVREDLTTDEMKRVLLHESLHMALHISGQSERLVDNDNDNQEEGLVQMLEYALPSIIEGIYRCR